MGRQIEFTSSWGTKYTLAFEKTNYIYNYGLAIEVHCKEDGCGWWEPYGTLTVNICEPTGDKRAYLDTNNLRDLCKRVFDEGWVTQVGEGRSGFCTYPLVEFTDEFLDEICYGEGDEL